MEPTVGAQLAVEAIMEKGVEHIFTLSGGHITPIYKFLENTSVKLFDVSAFSAQSSGKR